MEVDVSAVLVAGSGKESFKTFNVSTAAAILAAAAGAKVIKGVSSSVSAVSGSADVLDHLGVPTCAHAGEIPDVLGRDGIAFVRYSTFCPIYAARYDGVFRTVTPFSFFMPVAVLAVRAQAFVYGIAHHDVARAATAIRAARRDIPRGTVVATSFAGQQYMDEAAPFGRTLTAEVNGSCITTDSRQQPDPHDEWTRAVRHRLSHRSNAEQVVASLNPTPPADAMHGAELVAQNAALIVRAHHNYTVSEAAALDQVKRARANGSAGSLLAELRSTNRQVRRAS